MKEYGYDCDSTHSAIIYEKGTEAEKVAKTGGTCTGYTDGVIVGSSEWGWLEEEQGRRICAALKFFSETTTEEIERIADAKFNT